MRTHSIEAHVNMSSFESLSASHRFKFKNRGTTKPSHDVDLYVYQVRSRRSLPIKSLRVHKNGSKCQKLRVSLRYAYFDPALRAGSKSAPLQTNIQGVTKVLRIFFERLYLSQYFEFYNAV